MSVHASELADGAPADATTGPSEKASKPPRAVLFGAAAFGIVCAAGGLWFTMFAGRESTDDAQVDADVVAVPSKASGTATKVLFTDNQFVKAGDVLAELDSAMPQAKLAEAEASLASAKATADAADADALIAEVNARGQKSVAEASLRVAAVSATGTGQQIAEGEADVVASNSTRQQAETDLNRAKGLFTSGSIPKQQLDNAQAAFDKADANLNAAKAHLVVLKTSTAQAQAHIEEATAKLSQSSAVEPQIAEARARAQTAHAQVLTALAARDLAALELSYAKVLAPSDGQVSKKAIVAGQMINAGQTIVMLVPTKDVWVTGNFKETQLAHMRIGNPAEFSVDAYPGTTFKGEVESFSGATGARFSLLPPDNATGNFTKVIQRVPVRIRITTVADDRPLRPGMSVDLTIDTRK